MPEVETNSAAEINTATISSEEKTEIKLDDFPRFEELLKSEKEVKSAQKVEGVVTAEAENKLEDRPFKRKSDEKKVLAKRRLKIITGVYVSVLTTLLAFVGINAVTLAIMNKDIATNTDTIQAQTQQVQEFKAQDASNPLDPVTISLNAPRDYEDDKKELTFLDKITILFRNIFG